MKIQIEDKIAAAKLRDRAKGAIWGLIVGDCLGSPFQFGPRCTGRMSWPGQDEGRPLPMASCKTFDCPPGYWTDDGSMALCIMDSFIRRKALVVGDVAQTFLRWYRDGYLSSIEGRSFDVGGATASSLTKFGKTGSLHNGSESTQGNGAVMRFAPSFFAAYATADSEEVADELMCAVGDITHASSVVRKDIETLADIFRSHIMKGVKTKAYKEILGKTPYDNLPNGGWSPTTVQAACCYFIARNTFAESLTDAALAGGDADTIAAVTGQIAGSYYGYEAIPREWIEAVKDWRKIDGMIEQFLDLAIAQQVKSGTKPLWKTNSLEGIRSEFKRMNDLHEVDLLLRAAEGARGAAKYGRGRLGDGDGYSVAEGLVESAIKRMKSLSICD